MADKNPTLTRETGFNISPACPGGLLSVRPGADANLALVDAKIILTYLKDRNVEMVGIPDAAAPDENYIHAMLLDMAMALYSSAGAEG